MNSAEVNRLLAADASDQQQGMSAVCYLSLSALLNVYVAAKEEAAVLWEQIIDRIGPDSRSMFW